MSAGATYEPIAKQTLASPSSSITFSSITGTYTDLVLILNAKTAAGGIQLLKTRVGNGSIDTATNYSCTWIGGYNGGTFSSRDTSSNAAIDMRISDAAWSSMILQFQNYSNSTTNKTFFTRSNNPNDEIWQGVNLWRSTNAINTIQVFPDGGQSFATGTEASLYGIAAA